VSGPAGFTDRPATLDDAATVAELVDAYERAHVSEPDVISAAEVRDWWKRLELERDSRLFFDAEGRLAGAASLYERIEGRLDLDAYVRPELTGRGLGTAMLDWLEDEAAARGREGRTGAVTADEAAGRLLTARGYETVRRFYRMAIDLDAPPSEPAWPAGFEVATFQPGEEAILHAVTEEAFADHWGHEPRDLDHWQAHTFEASWWDPSLVYLVREGDVVVASEMCAVRFGAGWVNTIGTLKPWRGRGLGRALLESAFAEFYRRGERRVTLAVDAARDRSDAPVRERRHACLLAGGRVGGGCIGRLRACRGCARGAPIAGRTPRSRSGPATSATRADASSRPASSVCRVPGALRPSAMAGEGWRRRRPRFSSRTRRRRSWPRRPWATRRLYSPPSCPSGR
jgi:mycothiol synthase